MFLDRVPLFSVLKPYEKDLLASSGTLMLFHKDDVIVREGEQGNLFYMIISGCAEITQNGKFIRYFGESDFFGEQALLYNQTRTATVKAIEDLEAFSIERSILIDALGESMHEILFKNSIIIAVEKNSEFTFLRKEQIEKLVQAMKFKDYYHGELVISEGKTIGDEFLIVVRGKLESNGSTLVHTHGCLGDYELCTCDFETKYEYDVNAEVDCHVARIEKHEFELAIGGPVENVRTENEVEQILENVELFSSIERSKLLELVRGLKLVTFNRMDFIFKQHQKGDALYIIKEGTVRVIKSGIEIRSLNVGAYFGERAIIQNEIRSSSV